MTPQPKGPRLRGWQAAAKQDHEPTVARSKFLGDVGTHISVNVS